MFKIKKSLLKKMMTQKEMQIVVAIEELSELTKELGKLYRYGQKVNIVRNIKEEIADVEIVLEEIKYMLKLKEKEIDEIKKEKIKRTEEKYFS